MKRFYLLIITLIVSYFCMTTASYCQFKNEAKLIGISFGATSSKYRIKTGPPGIDASGTLGGFCSIYGRYGKIFGIEPTLTYSTRGTHIDFPAYDPYFSSEPAPKYPYPLMADYHTHNLTFELPLSISFQPFFDFSIGPYIGGYLGGKRAADVLNNDEKVKQKYKELIGLDPFVDIKKVDYGLSFSICAGYILCFYVRYDLGLANLSKTEDFIFKSSSIMFGLKLGIGEYYLK